MTTQPTPAEVLISSLAKDIQSLVLTTVGYTSDMARRLWNSDDDGRQPFLQLAAKHVTAAEAAFTPAANAIDWEMHESTMRRMAHGRAGNIDGLYEALFRQAEKFAGRPEKVLDQMVSGDWS